MATPNRCESNRLLDIVPGADRLRDPSRGGQARRRVLYWL